MMPDDAPGYRYAALVFSPPPGPSGPDVMYGPKETFVGKFVSLLSEQDDHDRWRGWVGSLAWDKIERAQRVVVGRAASDGPPSSVPRTTVCAARCAPRGLRSYSQARASTVATQHG